MVVREHGDRIDDRELAGLADGVLTGGLETTASMLALGVLVLLGDQECVQQVRVDDAAADGVVEELLRHLSVVQVAFPRFVREDHVISGVQMATGDLVLCLLSGANRDDCPGADMTSFDPRREARPHMAFGYGIHRCIGAEPGRMQLRAVFPALARRFPAMRLAVEPEDIAFRTLSVVHGVESLPVHVH